MAQGDDTAPWTPQSLGPAAAGMRRRQPWAESAPVDMRGDWEKERQAALTHFSAEPDLLRGLYNRLTGDDAAAEAAYGRALQTQQRAAEQDSNVSTSWRDWGSVGDAAAGVRKVLTGSAPDMALALGAGGVGRGLARRTVGNIERRAAVQQVEQRLANEGIDSLVGRKVAENAARKPAAAASPQVAQAQFQDAIERTGADLVRRAPGAQGRIDAAGRAGFIAGSTAGAFPGIAAQDTQELSQTDREGTLRMLPYQLAQAALEPLVEARLAGRALGNPYVKEALQEGLGATRGALSKLPGRIAKETVHNVATEAGTEGMQALLQAAGQRAGRGEDPLAFTADDWAGALDQAIVGGLAGGAMGGSVEAVNASVPAAVDAAGRAVRAGAAAGRWAWDKTGSVRQALRERIRTAAEKRRSPLDAMDGGADPWAQDAPADLGARAGAAAKQAFDTAGSLFDKAKQGLTSAARRFRGAQDDLTQADDLDAAANDAMDFIDRAIYPTQRRALPEIDGEMSGLHQTLARGINPGAAYVFENPVIAGTYVNAMHDYVTGAELTPVRRRALERITRDPNSGVSLDALDFIKERVRSIQDALKTRRGKGEGIQGAAGELAAMAEDPESGVTAQRGREVFAQSTAAKVVDAAAKLRDLKTSLGARAETSPEFEAARKEHDAARVALHRQLVRPDEIFVRNNTALPQFEAADADPGNVRLVNKKDVYGNGKLLQPRAVRLSGLIGRARGMMRQEGTPDHDVSAFKALQYALGAMQLAGDPIDVTTFKPGDVKDAKGNVVMRLTPANIKSLQATARKLSQEQKTALGALEAARGPERPKSAKDEAEKDLEFVRSGEPGVRDAAARDAKYLDERAGALIARASKLPYEAAQPYYDEAKALRAQARALARAAATTQEVQGYNESEFADSAPLSSFHAETPPAGTRNADGSFTPSMGVVSDVRVSSPHEGAIRELYAALRKAENSPGEPPLRSEFDATADYDAAVNKWSKRMRVFARDMRKYSDQVLAAGPMMAARFTAGQKIGAAELEGDLLDGKISKAQYDAKIEELNSPENPLAEEYLTRALNGEFDSASASLVGADDPQAVYGVEGDFGGGVRPPGTRELVIQARQEAARAAEEARAAASPAERAAANAAAAGGTGVAGKRAARAATPGEIPRPAPLPTPEADQKRLAKSKKLEAENEARRAERLAQARREAEAIGALRAQEPAPRRATKDELRADERWRTIRAARLAQVTTGVAGRRAPQVSAQQLRRFKEAVASRRENIDDDAVAKFSNAVPASMVNALNEHMKTKGREVRRLGADQARAVIVARQLVSDTFGFDVDAIVTGVLLLRADNAAAVTSGFRGRPQSVISITPQSFTSAVKALGDTSPATRLLRVYTHEVTHALDNALLAHNASPSAAAEFSVVMDEARAAVESGDPLMQEWFGYTLDATNPPREVFAQLGALKMMFPEILDARFPNGKSQLDAAAARVGTLLGGQRQPGQPSAAQTLEAQRVARADERRARFVERRAEQAQPAAASDGVLTPPKPQGTTLRESPSSGYRERTKHNADSAGLTVAIAKDFTTAGERLTKSVAGGKYLPIDFDTPATEAGQRLALAMQGKKTSTLNVAGNGIYTLVQYGLRQAAVNQHVYDILRTAHAIHPITHIVSGGQTGVDIAAAVAAEKLGIPATITFPQGFRQRIALRDGGHADITQTEADVRAQIAKGVTHLTQKEEATNTQNDELTPEQTDAIDAGAKSASSDGRHDLKAERTMLNTILGMLGVTEQIGALRTLKDADERGNKGGSYARRSRTVSINPNLHGAERVEVLMHELGHHIIWNEIAKYVDGGFDALQGMTLAESIDVLAKGNPKLYAALRKDFDQWNTTGRPSQSPTHRYLRGVTNGLARTFKDDHHAFHEWFADNIARSLAGKRPVVGVVGKFFAKIATQLRKAWSVISATPSLKPAPSVDAWVKQMLNANVAAVKEATGQAAPQAKAEATVRGAVAAQAAKAGPVKYTMENVGDLVALIDTVLPIESRQLLERVFNRPVVLTRLQQVYADNPVVKRMLDHPSQGASARIAFGYLAWQDGLLKTGPQGQNALLGLSDSVLRLFGAAGDGALAQRTLYDIQTGAVQRFKDAGKIYSARDLAARNGNNFQRALNWVNRMVESSPASNALAAFWTGNNTRMRESGIPALRTLATMLDRPQGSIGESNPGLITNIRVQTARWNRQMREALEPLTDRQRLRVLRALQRRAKVGDKAFDSLPEAARVAVDTIREMFRGAYRYQREAGYTEDDLGHIRDYMPVIMDVRNENARAKLTALYSKPEYARDVAIAAGFVKPDEKGLYDGAEVKAVTDDPEQMAKAVEYLVRAAANDGQTPPPTGAAGRFHFRHQNTQLSAFIYRHGNPDDIKTLASLQTRDPGEVFARYFAPMVRWTEMARMFGEVEPVLDKKGNPVINPHTGLAVMHMNPRAKLDALLEQAKAQGATDGDVAFADNAVRAALGVYGADGSPTIAAVSPWAAEKLKGRKAQSVIEGVQAYQNARLLPLALLSNLVDPVGIAVRTGGEFNDAWAGFKEGMGFVRAALSKDPQAAKRMLKELEDIDVSEDFLPALAANPVFEGGRTGKARAVNDFVFKWNGVQTWITATRVMAMYAGHKFLLRHKQLPNEHSERYLQELGLTAKDIVEDPNNPGKVEINDKTRAALRQFVDEAILRPNSQQAPLWMSDPYMGIVAQYKMFAYAIWDQIGGRIGREVTQGNMRVVVAALMYLPVIVMAELVREMIQTAGEGDDRRKDWGPIEYTKLAADRSGLLGPQYQIMGDIKGDIERARLPGTSQLGPAINQGRNVLDALQGRRDKGKEFESALPWSPLYRKWNDDMGESAGEAAAAA